MNDPRDFTDRYNTQLPADVEKMFGAWLVDESKRQGRNLSNDLYDYDLRGMWNAGAGFGGDNGHATDSGKSLTTPRSATRAFTMASMAFRAGIGKTVLAAASSMLQAPQTHTARKSCSSIFSA